MRHLDDPAAVRRHYADESRLSTRASVWRPTADGRTPQDVAARAVAACRPGRVLEVGCGTGRFAQRLAEDSPSAQVVATDQSQRMVELTQAHGLAAQRADIQNLPFGDAAFDVVVAMWMLYHVPDLDGGLAEVRRVLRPEGTFVAVTNGEQHLAGLLAEAGGTPLATGFSTENGALALRRHFGTVGQDDLVSRAVMVGHAAAQAYLASFDPTLAGRLPAFDGPREYAGATSVFVSR